jgi:hypothetical protein
MDGMNGKNGLDERGRPGSGEVGMDNQEIEERYQRELRWQRGGKWRTAAVALLILAALGAGVYFLFLAAGKGERVKPETGTPVVQQESEPVAEKKRVRDPALPEAINARLNDSDAVTRELGAKLSADRLVSVFLKENDLIRRFVAAVDTVAAGGIPSAQMGFLKPAQKFEVMKKSGRIYLDPAGFRRFDRLGAAASSLDEARCAAVYRLFEPLLQEAYRELGYPEGDFNRAAVQAANEILAAPAVEGNIELAEKGMGFAFSDPKLEELSDARKLLVRMGPQNLAMLQLKTRRLLDLLELKK